jgi:hypothetical protein
MMATVLRIPDRGCQGYGLVSADGKPVPPERNLREHP